MWMPPRKCCAAWVARSLWKFASRAVTQRRCPEVHDDELFLSVGSAIWQAVCIQDVVFMKQRNDRRFESLLTRSYPVTTVFAISSALTRVSCVAAFALLSDNSGWPNWATWSDRLNA